MLLGLEIALTIAAFRKGWGVLSIVPIAAAFFAGMMVGHYMTSLDDARMIALAGDILVVVILGVMASKEKKAAAPISPIPYMPYPQTDHR